MIDFDKILPNLFVGSCPRNVEGIDRLKESGITAVLNVQTDEDFASWGIDWDQLADHYRHLGIEVRRVPVRDFDPDHLRERLPECVRVLDELLQSGHTVYVHCSGGINRSPTVVIAYLMELRTDPSRQHQATRHRPLEVSSKFRPNRTKNAGEMGGFLCEKTLAYPREFTTWFRSWLCGEALGARTFLRLERLSPDLRDPASGKLATWRPDVKHRVGQKDHLLDPFLFEPLQS